MNSFVNKANLLIHSDYKKFVQLLGKDRVLLNEELKNYTTFKIGGPADLFFTAKTSNDLKTAVKTAKKLDIPYFILGGGSNVLISDRGFKGVVIKIKNSSDGISCLGRIAGRQFKIENSNQFVFIKAESGVLVNHLVKYTLDKGLSGLEHFFGLPGTVGGAVYGKAHFQGKNINSAVFKIERLDDVILSVVFKLKRGSKEELWRAAKVNFKYRQATQPLSFPSAGCIFQNPKPYSAGYLIEKCNLKGRMVGGAMISKKHANFIVNANNALCHDVLKLIDLCRKRVEKKFGINLVEEIVKVGDFNE